MAARLVRWLALRVPPALLRNPFGINVMLAASIGGLLILFVPDIPLPPTIASELGLFTGKLWAMVLALGGVVGLVGYFGRQWRLEVSGLLFLATASVVYGVVLLVGFGGAGIVAGFGFLGVCVASLLRALAVASAQMIRENHTEPDRGG